MASVRERSGRDVVIEISADALERLALDRLRGSLELSCVSLDLVVLIDAALAGLFRSAYGLAAGSHVPLSPLAFSLLQMSDGMQPSYTAFELELVVPVEVAASGRYTVRGRFDLLLTALTAAGVDLFPAELGVFASLGGSASVGPVYRAAGSQRSALIIGYNLSNGAPVTMADNQAWDAYAEDFTGARDWAIAFDAALMQQYVDRRLAEEVERSHHEGVLDGRVGPGRIEIAVVDHDGSVRRVANHTVPSGRWSHGLAGNFGGQRGWDDLLLYDNRDGAVETFWTDGSGSFQSIRSAQRIEPGLTAFLLGPPGRRTLLGYRANVGLFVTYQITPGGTLLEVARRQNLYQDQRAGWRGMVRGPLDADGRQLVLALTGTRSARLYRIDDAGALIELRRVRWSRAWDHVVAVDLAGRAAFFCYAAGDGGSELWGVEGDQLVQLGSATLEPGFGILVGGELGGDGSGDLLGYHPERGTAVSYRLTGGDAAASERARFDDWRVGWDGIMPGRFARGGGTGTRTSGILFFDRTDENPAYALEYLRGRWAEPTVIEGRGQYHAPICGDVDFGFFAEVRLAVSNGRITYQLVVTDGPNVDHDDRARLFFCGFGIGFAVGLVLGGAIGAIAGGLAAGVSVGLGLGTGLGLAGGAFVAAQSGSPPEQPEETVASARLELPGGGQLVGRELVNSADGLAVLGDLELDARPLPDLQVIPPSDAVATRRDKRGNLELRFYESGGWVCAGKPPVYPERIVRLVNRGPGTLHLCEIQIVTPGGAGPAPGFALTRVEHDPPGLDPSPLSVGDGGRLGGLPLSLPAGTREVGLHIAYQGPPDVDHNAVLRILTSDPEQPFFSIALSEVTGRGVGRPQWDPRGVLEIKVANTESGRTTHAVHDCRIDDIRHITDELPAAALVISNPSRRPLYLCRVDLEDSAAVFRIASRPSLIPPGGQGAVALEFFPHDVMRLYTGRLSIRTSAALIPDRPDIVVDLVAQVVPEPDRAEVPALSAGDLEIIYDRYRDVICGSPDLDICRSRRLFEPLRGGSAVALVALSNLPAHAEVTLVDRAGEPSARSLLHEARRPIPVELPDEGDFTGNPCIARIDGISPLERSRVRIDLALREVTARPGPAELTGARAVRGRGGTVWVGGERGLAVLDWPVGRAPRVLRELALGEVTGLELVEGALVAAVGDEVVVLDLADPAAPVPAARARVGGPVRALAASAAGVFASHGAEVAAFPWRDGKLGSASLQRAAGRVAGLVALKDALIAAHAEGVELMPLTGKAAARGLMACAAPPRLGRFGQSVLVHGPAGTDVIEWVRGRPVPAAWYRRRHFALDLVPDHSLARMYRVQGSGVELVEVAVRHLDPVRFAGALTLRYRPRRPTASQE